MCEEMVATEIYCSSFSILTSAPHHHHHHHLQLTRNGRKCLTTVAKKKDLSENSRTQQQQQLTFPVIRVPSIILARSAIAIFGLGFIDAGYSGDWTRIGVISKESEDLLKAAAFFVVPLCVFLLFSISKPEEA